jgi:hypothetical protein
MFPQQNEHPLWSRILGAVGFAILAGSLLWQFYISAHYLANAPDRPEPSLGRTFQFRVHKQVVYLTESESERANNPWVQLIMVAGVALFFIAVRANESKR